MLTCKELTETITDYLEDRLTLRERIRVQLHLGMCWRCRAYLRQMKATRTLLGALPPLVLPPELREELMARFGSLKRSRSAKDPGTDGH